MIKSADDSHTICREPMLPPISQIWQIRLSPKSNKPLTVKIIKILIKPNYLEWDTINTLSNPFKNNLFKKELHKNITIHFNAYFKLYTNHNYLEF